MSKVVVIGSGFAGLAAACSLAYSGFKVQVLEKNKTAGGRARRFQENGYTFDMGPSWYWMPDVFERFFQRFDRNVHDYYQLTRLDPSYRMFFSDQSHLDIPADYSLTQKLFDSIEPGSGEKLTAFLEQAELKYKVGMEDLVYKPGISPLEFVNLRTLNGAYKLDLLQSFHRHVRKFFNDPRLLQILTFPILFLGASAKDTPALYSLMNYADLKLGTWYPEGGMYSIVAAMEKLAMSLGVEFYFSQEVNQINTSGSTATSVVTNDGSFTADLIVASADYHHIESTCLPPDKRSYSESYWESRTMAPSSLIFYLGCSKKLEGLHHHNLFFDESLEDHTEQIYKTPKWPDKPLFYASVTSKTDPSVCPEGHENLFLLIPVAPGLEDTEEIREKYYQLVMDRLEKKLGEDIRSFVVYKRSYAHSNFIEDYHAFKGNAYGLANTVRQTAFLKPKIKSKKINNLYYTGQLTVPGPGVPPSLISGQIVADQIVKDFEYETAV